MKIETFKYCNTILIVFVMILGLSVDLKAQNDNLTKTDLIKIEEAPEDDKIFHIVEKMPEFPGGNTELIKYIATNIKYPKSYQECAIEGKVYIRFCVTDSGIVEKVSVIRGVDPLLDKEAVRVVKTLPKWIPGEQNGKKVSVWYTVPVLFKLE